MLNRKRNVIGKRLATGLAVFAMTVAGVVAAVRAQTPVCRDFGALTVCADEDQSAAAAPAFDAVMTGNVKIGPKGQPAVLLVTDVPDGFNGISFDPGNRLARFILDNDSTVNGAPAIVIGDVKLIGDPSNQPIFGTRYAVSSATGLGVAGRLHLDLATMKLKLPQTSQVPLYVTNSIKREQVYFYNNFIFRTGVTAFYKSNTLGISDFAPIEAEFDIGAKKFNGILPIDLKLIGPSLADTDEPSLVVTVRATIANNGAVSGALDGFKTKIAGMKLDVKGVTLSAVDNSFTAAQVDVQKADNPNVPSLTASATTMFSFTNLKYKGGEWSIGGVSVPIGDWEFGDALRMKNQTLSLLKKPDNSGMLFQGNSTLEFGGSGAQGTTVPALIKISSSVINGVKQPNIEAGLSNFNPSIGPLKLSLKNVTIAGNPGENFFGLKAQTFDLQWPANLGGQTAAGLSNFRIGVDKDKKGVFSLGAANIGLPALESSIIRITLSGSPGMVGNTPTISMTGNMTLKIAGNSGVGAGGTFVVRTGKNLCPPADDPSSGPRAGINKPPPNCLKRTEGTLNSFNFKIAGFSAIVNTANLNEDGGFSAQTIAMGLPNGLSQGNGVSITVNGFSVAGNGDVKITGGGFDVGTFAIGNFQFGGVRGTFKKDPTTGYVFQAGAKFPLPGIEPGTDGPGISALVTVRVNPSNSTIGGGVVVSFTAPFGAGIPIGNTGMELTGISGGFDINAGTVQIVAGMQANTLLRFPAPLNLPIAKVTGSTTLQFNPFRLTANAQLTILVFQVANANMGIGHNVAFNNTAPGFHLEVNITGLIVSGGVKLDVGRVTVGGQLKTRVVAAGNVTIGVPKGRFLGLPLVDRTFAGISVTGGHFKDNRTAGGKEKVGVKGTINLGPFSATGFADLSASPIDLIASDVDLIVPFNTAQIRAAAAAREEGFGSRIMAMEEVANLGMLSADRRSMRGINGETGVDAAAIMQDVVPVVVTRTTRLSAFIVYGTGNPTARLRLPSGTVLTSATVNGTSQRYGLDSGGGQTAAGYEIDDAVPGTYQLLIDNAPASYEFKGLLLNQAPKLALGALTCGGAPITGVTLQCNAVGAGSTANISWVSSDSDSPDYNVRVGYAAITDVNLPVDYTSIKTLAEFGPGDGGYTWNVGEVPSGKYKLVVSAEDDGAAAVWRSAPTVIDIVDARPPAVPSGFAPLPQAAEMLIKWNQNSELDLAGYEIGFGLVNDGKPDTPDNFVYARNMGPKIVLTGTNSIVDAKLWGLEDNVDMYFSIRAYDVTGNKSDWAPMQFAKPWALGPNNWVPLPNGEGELVPYVEVGFSSPLKPESVDGSFSVVGPNGLPVFGRIERLLSFDETQVYGVRFTPWSPLAPFTPYRALLSGGAAGVTAADGRTMGGNYSWSFVTGAAAPSSATTVSLPMVHR